MDNQVGMRDGDYLTLLNKPNHTMQEENDLQAEIKRRQELETAQKANAQQVENAAVNEAIANDPSNQVEATQPNDNPVPPTAQEQTQAVETPVEPSVNPAQPESVAPEVPQEPSAPTYDLTQLESDTQQAIDFLNTQTSTEAIEYAKSNFKQAAYWTKLASEGK